MNHSELLEKLQERREITFQDEVINRDKIAGMTSLLQSLLFPDFFKLGMGSEEILDIIRTGFVSYVINTRAILSGVHYGDGIRIRTCAAQNNVPMLTSLDTVRMLLDVLEEMTMGISTIDAV